MTDKSYIVLREEETFVPEFGALGVNLPVAARRSLGMGANSGIKVQLSEETLNKRQKDDLRRDPRTRAVARSMPLQLITPEAVDLDVNGDAVTWGVKAVGADSSSFDGDGITVAVLDTGIDPDHPAFDGVELIRQNFTQEGDDDNHGHGTHCAGTIFGRSVANKRIGVAHGVKTALIGKVLGAGGGSSATLADAINWAASGGAHVISMSLGIDFPGFVKDLMEFEDIPVEPATSIALEQYRANVNLFNQLAALIEARSAFEQGSVIVAASGNESNRPTFEVAVAPPAAGTGIISVGALQNGVNGLSVARFSNTQCNVSAPGVAIESAKLGGGLVGMNGTSMATPHVAGVAALWAQRDMSLMGTVRAENLAANLLASAIVDNFAPGAELEDIGNGIVRAP